MRVDDAQIQLRVDRKPAHFRAEASGGAVQMVASPLQVSARCQVEPEFSYRIAPDDFMSRTSPRDASWKLGFMQVQILETAWAYYRGAQSADGCQLNDTAARRSSKVCRDYDRSSGTVWYEGSKSIGDCYGLPDRSLRPPWNLEFYFGDSPDHGMPAKVLNEQTQRYNYLREARCALAFVTTLTEGDQGVHKHHRHFLWSAIWHIQAASTEPQKVNTTFRLLAGSGFWISEFKRGGPIDRRYLDVLNNSSLTPSANEVVEGALVAKSVASDWQRFPLMDRKDKLF